MCEKIENILKKEFFFKKKHVFKFLRAFFRKKGKRKTCRLQLAVLFFFQIDGRSTQIAISQLSR